MKTSTIISIFSLLGVALQAAAQAPGDHNEFCRTGTPTNRANRRNFLDSWEILVDSYDYLNLFSGRNSAWTSTSQDNDNVHFQQLIGGSCGWSAFICNTRPAEQNNWLFSQFIKFTEAKEIYFEMIYSFNSLCSECPNYITMNRYDVDSSVSAAEQTDTANYSPMLRLGGQFQEDTPSLVRPDTKGFYLGFHDEGTCGQLSRVIAYYTVCRARQSGLVMYPQVATPPRNGPDEVFSAHCVPNAHNVTSLAVNAFSASSTCQDAVPGGAKCECNAGYEMSSSGSACIPCKAGTYRALGSGPQCLSCPANTETNAVATAECQCLTGMFRSKVPGMEEGPEADCSVPPSAVRELEIFDSDSDSIILTWKRPETAGKNLFYEILQSDSVSIMAISTPVENSFKDDSELVIFAVPNLRPFTNYVFSVVTHNAVSDQDPTNADRRKEQVVGKTTEGVPGLPSLNRLCTVLIWRPPTEPAGVITGYEVRFGEETFTFGPDERFYITDGEQRAQNALAEIRVTNTLNSSPWTEPLPIDCSNMNDCPTSAPPPPIVPFVEVDSKIETIDMIACEPLIAPDHGSLVVDDREATYSCDEGFVLSGGQSRTCQSDGTWSGEAPTCISSCKAQPLYFTLKGIRHENNTMISVGELGENEDALLAITPNQECCRSRRIGEFYYPDGSMVPINGAGESLYRNRATQLIRLHRRGQTSRTSIPRGKYRCELPDACGEMVSLYVTLV